MREWLLPCENAFDLFSVSNKTGFVRFTMPMWKAFEFILQIAWKIQSTDNQTQLGGNKM